MEKQFKNIVLATLSLLSLGLTKEIAQSSTLVMGKNGAMHSTDSVKISEYNLASESTFFQASSGANPISLINSLGKQNNQQNLANLSNNQVQQLVTNNLAITDKSEEAKITSLEDRDLQAIQYYEMPSEEASPIEIVGANTINQSVQDRYQNLVESQVDQTSLISARKLLANEPNPEIATQVINTSSATQQPIAFIPSEGLLEAVPQQNKNVLRFPLPLFTTILLLIGWRCSYILKFFR